MAGSDQKSYFDVLGLCCSSEVPLIEGILKPLEGIKEVNVIVASRTVIVVHDNGVISENQIVKALNKARLEANVRVYGQEKHGNTWPSPYTMVCGFLLLVSLFKFIFDPLKWVAIGAVAIGLLPIIFKSVAAIQNFRLHINILVVIAVGGTIAMKDYLEAGTIVFLFSIAEWLESRASHKATVVMSSLMNMVPQKAILAETGQVIDAKDVKLSMILAVKTGEVIPIDGVVVEGNCDVDEKTLTGESFPVSKQNQSNVWAGTINVNGYISVRTTALAQDCVVAKMAKLVEEAQNNKSSTQRFIDNCAKYYTPIVVLISIGLVVVPAALHTHRLKHWLHLSLVVLVSACPCALVLSTPVATFCAFTKAATTGVLIKGGDYLEILAKTKIVAFDKTGTITSGEFSVTDFKQLSSDASFNTLLYWVSSLERKSSHPMAAALVEYGQLNSVKAKPESVQEFQNFPGEGIYGEIDGKQIYVGNKRIAIRAGCGTVPTLEVEAKGGATIGYIFKGATLVGTFSLADSCRTGVSEAIKELKSMGIKTVMLTGDTSAAALRVNDQIKHAIDVVHAELLPEEKVKIIKELKIVGHTVMIGDGVNDAPALATADIGISMGISGSALATETGDITLMSNDVRKIPQAIRLARRTRWKIIQNVGLSISTKTAILALAFAGHPLLWAAVLADVGTCVVVILNSMLLLRGTNRDQKRHKKHTCVPHHAHSHENKPHNGCGHSHAKSGLESNNIRKASCCSREDVPNGCGDKKGHVHKEEISKNHYHDHHNHGSHPCNGSYHEDVPNGCRNNTHSHENSSQNGCGHSHPKSGLESNNIRMASCCSHEDVPNGCGDKKGHVQKEEISKNHHHNDHHYHDHDQHNHDSHLCNGHQPHSEAGTEPKNLHGHSSCLYGDSPNVYEDNIHEVHVEECHDHHHDHDHEHHHHSCLQESEHIEHLHKRESSKPSGGDTILHITHDGTIGKVEEIRPTHVCCTSLKQREIGGCCNSFRKECGGFHRGFGGVSEIITE
ncbi:hypothetical protein GIB67_023270 [Kingdonia uniflora]|uniref:HMA domain-containing protein n=1 Tax=Kingdonia uniflora TaxID=39325 RepID=A0A7J7MSF4_9MAGN|nr:hypothetical protein GIB67_023270 [Kingdonia uniflora]